MYSGKKISSSNWLSVNNTSIRNSMSSPGNSNFRTLTEITTGANLRSSINDGVGVYSAFFNKKNITKIALIDGSSNSLNPSSHDNYLIYELIESTSEESIYDILLRLDIYQENSLPFHNNDNVWGIPSVLNHTAGLNGYSGLLIESGGTDFNVFTRSGQNRGLPDKFCVMGINRQSDNDIQALCAFWGNLQTGKNDAWRGQNPEETFWSYWGDDFHTDSRFRRIGNQLQTAPGVATQCSWDGDVYLLAF
jgi:hypothetical protein